MISKFLGQAITTTALGHPNVTDPDVIENFSCSDLIGNAFSLTGVVSHTKKC